MKKERILTMINKLKLYTISWALLGSKDQNAYIVGFLECKRQIKEILNEN